MDGAEPVKPYLLPRVHAFDCEKELVRTLGDEVASSLRSAIAERGVAYLTVSGGSTPEPLFEHLSRCADIDWSRVCITLADERCVPADHEASNAALVRNALLKDEASAARFIPLFEDGQTPVEAATQAAGRLARECGRFDVVLLGMGEDGHTASIFPDSAVREQALDPDGLEAVLATPEPHAGHVRITQTLPSLTDTDFLAFLITGAKKHALLCEMLEGDGDHPAHRFLFQERAPAHVYLHR